MSPADGHETVTTLPEFEALLQPEFQYKNHTPNALMSYSRSTFAEKPKAAKPNRDHSAQ